MLHFTKRVIKALGKVPQKKKKQVEAGLDIFRTARPFSRLQNYADGKNSKLKLQ